MQFLGKSKILLKTLHKTWIKLMDFQCCTFLDSFHWSEPTLYLPSSCATFTQKLSDIFIFIAVREISWTAQSHTGFSFETGTRSPGFSRKLVWSYLKQLPFSWNVFWGKKKNEVGPQSICKLSMKLKEPLIGSFRLTRNYSWASANGCASVIVIQLWPCWE